MKKINLKKILIYLSYIFLLLISFNIYYSYQRRKKENNIKSIFYEKLFELEYYPNPEDPYARAFNLDLNPSTFFSLPIKSNDKLKLNNKVFSLNSRGYRDTPKSIIKSDENTKCVLFLGSSAAFGIGSTSDSNNIPSVLQKSLGENYRVYNLAIPSWNSKQEKISLFDFLKSEEKLKCKSIDTISYTGSTDINGIFYALKSSLYNDNESSNYLIDYPENYEMLVKNVDYGIKSSRSIFFNFKSSSKIVLNYLFGEYKNLFNRNKIKNQILDSDILMNEKELTFMKKKIEAFIINQKIINNTSNMLNGKHILIIQADLKNYNPQSNWRIFANKYLTKRLNEEQCFSKIDFRNFIFDKSEFAKIKKTSLKKDIENSLQEKIYPNNYFYFDDSHLTDKGYGIVAQEIYEIYKNDNKISICKL
tara:strand:+ start:3609 stop:4865 length:1257 start_codon:yes stop_codon:yes gene_type:complete